MRVKAALTKAELDASEPLGDGRKVGANELIFVEQKNGHFSQKRCMNSCIGATWRSRLLYKRDEMLITAMVKDVT